MPPSQQQQQPPPPAARSAASVDDAATHDAATYRPDLSLEEMSRIMDVASTLRKERALIERQLNIDETKAELRKRLLEAAAISGDPVTQQEIDAAIEHYYDRLHTFEEPSFGLETLLAHLYVRRTALVGWAIALAGAAALLGGMFFAGLFPSERRDQMRARAQLAAIEARAETIQAIANGPLPIVGDLVASARDLAEQTELEPLAQIDQQLERTYNQLAAEYVLTIPGTPEEESAFPMDYTDEQGTRRSGYYVIVEAMTPEGNPAPVAIKDRQTGQVVQTSRWAELVPEAVYERLREDKQADGLLDENLFGRKVRGEMELEVELTGEAGDPVSRGGQLATW